MFLARSLSLIGLLCVALTFTTTVQAQRVRPQRLPERLPDTWTHHVAADTAYYKDGPQQGRAADGQLKAGTRARIIKDAGSYVQIETAEGLQAYVASDALEPAEPAQDVPPRVRPRLPNRLIVPGRLAPGRRPGAAGAANEPAAISPEVRELAKSGNAFAMDLYHRLAATDEGNLFYSPSSISTALAMAYAGAAGTTAEQMAGVLHFDMPADKLYPAIAQLAAALGRQDAESGVQVNVANRLWGQMGFGFRPEYLALTKDRFGAELAQVNFAMQAEAARDEINAWVAQQTNDKIQDLIPQGVIDALTRLVLTNAIYFKGDWTQPFDEKLTAKAPFHTGGKQVEVPLMHQESQFNYAESDDWQLLEVPYGKRDLSMVVVLPRARDGLAALEKSLSAEALAVWSTGTQSRKVRVFLPKFKMESEFSLKDALSALGMKLAFDPERADFSKMATSDELYISAVVHKAVVDVNEKGTEAAAATGVVIGVRSLPIGEPPTFRADHPFLFVIRDNATGSILFAGRVVNPGK